MFRERVRKMVRDLDAENDRTLAYHAWRDKLVEP